MTSEQLQAAPQAEEREVVGGRPFDDGGELVGRLLIALDVKQGPTESLADRRLLARKIARPREGDHRLVVMTGLQQLGSAAKQVVYVIHPNRF